MFSAIDMMDVMKEKKLETDTKRGSQKKSNRTRLCTLCVQY